MSEKIKELEAELKRWKSAHKALEEERDELAEENRQLRQREFGPIQNIAFDIAKEVRDQVFAETTVEERRALVKKGAEMVRERLKNFGKKKKKKGGK
jgi:argininosuccinate lyase